MEWVTIWGFVFGGTSLLNVAGYISFYKSKKKVENLTADGKEVEVAKDAMQLVKDVQSQLKESIQNQDTLRKQVHNYQNRLNSQGRSISEMRGNMIILAEITEKQIERKKYAESNICTFVDCDMRTPPIGTYRSSSDSMVIEDLMSKLKKGLKEEKVSEDSVEEVNEQKDDI